MTIFEPTYDMIIELDKLERLMPSYTEPLHFLSKTIRNKVWNLSDEQRLAKMLNVYNFSYSILIKALGENIDFVEQYAKTLDENSNKYSTYNLQNIYAPVYAHISVCKTGDMIKEHWRQLNPYFRKEYGRESLFKKDLIEILDEFFENIIAVCPDKFLVPLKNFNILLRGRRKEWKQAEDLMPPSIEVAIANNIVNRWNPSEKRYLYLVNGTKDSVNNIKVCFEEMRIKKDEIVTIANFKVAKEAFDKKIINLDFDDVQRQDIFNFMNIQKKKQTQELIEKIYSENIIPTKENIKKQTELQSSKTKKLACAFYGTLLLKEICDAIFVPLDSNEDSDIDLKDRCYKSFHVLAEYFENKGIAGIVFPSTRMRLLKQTGSNLVLFSPEDALPDINTFNVIKK